MDRELPCSFYLHFNLDLACCGLNGFHHFLLDHRSTYRSMRSNHSGRACGGAPYVKCGRYSVVKLKIAVTEPRCGSTLSCSRDVTGRPAFQSTNQKHGIGSWRMLELGSACHIFDREPRPCTSQDLAFSVSISAIDPFDGHPDSALYRKMEPGGVVGVSKTRKRRTKN